MDKIYLGVITGMHGIKGELKIKSDFERKELVFKKGFTILIDEKEHVITSYRTHKGFDLVTIDSLFDINLVNVYIKKNVYIKRDDLKLDTYLTNDLIGFEVVSNDKILGRVDSIVTNNLYKMLYVNGVSKFYIPIIDRYVSKVDITNKEVHVIDGESLIVSK